MKKPIFISILTVFIVTCISVNVIAQDFYVIPTNRVFISWDKKLAADKRFELVLDGSAVLDKETGLVWKKSIISLQIPWANAVDHCYSQNIDDRKGWRLPSVEELASLLDGSALPTGHPFSIQSGAYWTSTTDALDDTKAYYVNMTNGSIFSAAKTTDATYYVWPVRGGK